MREDESKRLEMYLKLKGVLGESVADTMMEQIPPFRWDDIARKSDIEFLAALMESRFDAIEARFIGVDARFIGSDYRFESIDTRFNSLDARFDSVDARFDSVNDRFTAIDTRLDAVDNKLEGLSRGLWAIGSIMTTCFIAMFSILVTQL